MSLARVRHYISRLRRCRYYYFAFDYCSRQQLVLTAS